METYEKRNLPSFPTFGKRTSVKTKLSVNVNKLATLRNSRGKNNPDVVATTLKIIEYGAEGITVHPRPDERHIRQSDVFAISQAMRDKHPSLEFNIEGYPSPNFLALLDSIRPHQATLVPDPPDALTSNAGWKLEPNEKFLKEIVTKIKNLNIRVSLFMDPEDYSSQTIEVLKTIGAHRIELYTEAYADAYPTPQRKEVTKKYLHLAKACFDEGIGINAGHDLDLKNLKYLVESIPYISEVSIGHALICDSLEMGLKPTIQAYLDCLLVDGLPITNRKK